MSPWPRIKTASAGTSECCFWLVCESVEKGIVGHHSIRWGSSRRQAGKRKDLVLFASCLPDRLCWDLTFFCSWTGIYMKESFLDSQAFRVGLEGLFPLPRVLCWKKANGGTSQPPRHMNQFFTANLSVYPRVLCIHRYSMQSLSPQAKNISKIRHHWHVWCRWAYNGCIWT